MGVVSNRSGIQWEWYPIGVVSNRSGIWLCKHIQINSTVILTIHAHILYISTCLISTSMVH